MVSKIVAISDTHNKHDQIVLPDGDVLVHAGDATYTGKLEEITAFAEWFIAQPHKHKIFVPGNHDFICQDSPEIVEELFAGSGVHYLIDKGVTIDDVSFYGTPWVINLPRWAFHLEEGSTALKEKFDGIPNETNILITHNPPYGKLDKVAIKPFRIGQQSVGSPSLLAVVEALPNLQYHVFGHIHEGYGVTDWYDDGPTFVNAAICTLSYRAENKPIEFEI